MTQRNINFHVPPDVARERLKAGLGTQCKARLDGDRLEYEYVLTTNYFGANHFYYLIAGRLQASPGGSTLQMTVTEIRRVEGMKWVAPVLMVVLGSLAVPVGLVASGEATVVFASWMTVISMVVLGLLVAGGFVCGSWFGREWAARDTAKQLQAIVGKEK